MRHTLFYGLCLFLCFSLKMHSAPLQMSEATMSCLTDNGDTFFIFAKQKKVMVYSEWNQQIFELKDLVFKTFRCPYCYFFSGKDPLSLVEFRGSTSSMFDEQTHQFVPTLKMDFQKPASCQVNEP